VLWILASVAIALLGYEIWTLLFAVIGPLLDNPNALQTDFHYYYEAARRFAADPNELYRASDDVIAGFTYPPPAIVPFVLLLQLPLGVALLLTTILSYAALVASLELWSSYLARHGITNNHRERIAMLLIAIAFGPAYKKAVFGPVNALVLLSAVAFVTLSRSAPVAAGFALGAGTWLKIYPVALVLLGAWDRKMRRAIAFAAIAAIAIAIGLLPLVPFAVYETFANILPGRAGATAIHITNQSLPAFLERFRHEPALFLNWTGQQAVAMTTIVRVLTAAVGVAVVGKLWFASRHDSRMYPASAAAMIALTSVLSPLGWGHTYVMAIPLVMMQLNVMRTASRPLAWLIFFAVAAMMIPAGRHLPIDGAPAWLQNVVYSRYLLATLALIVISTIPIGRSTRPAHVASA
jgi:alpha-1,2-mannosyltransferase